jgi:predicted TIM-barrel fold metal-dependent hydrolase
MTKRIVISRWLVVAAALWAGTPRSAHMNGHVVLNDAHFHLTDYVQHGEDIHKFLKVMGDSVGRVALFGIPLQQEWLYESSGDDAPTYYLSSDAPLYYYSFTDAYIAMQYRSLSPEEQARFDPMITGFNPGDLYAAEHIRRVLETFPGVFTGIGEFSVHKEFVSDKARPGPANLKGPAIDSILNVAGEVGLLTIMHNDMDAPFASGAEAPAYLEQMKALLRRHPKTTIIWAHTGVGRIARPVTDHAAVLGAMLADSTMRNLYFDISWDVVAERFMASPADVHSMAALINRYPDRFLFGTDAVAPTAAPAYLTTYSVYGPLWAELTPKAIAKVRVRNYERLFDTARSRVRAWEAAHRQ